MAELPDLTIFAEILSRKFKGATLDRIEVTEARKLNVKADELKSVLEGKQLMDVMREGKTLQLHFSGENILGLHLMLRGELVSLDDNEQPRFQILGFHFKQKGGFAMVDLQKQARPTLNPLPVPVPDALGLKEDMFKALIARKRSVIKTLLMDQKLMRGIGNSYADEILYHAGISPFSTASAIPGIAAGKLFRSISAVLDKAIKVIRQANGDELSGELKDFMEVHSPASKMTAKGEPILKGKIGGRTTYYTESQRLYS